jgi:hypothetical protein
MHISNVVSSTTAVPCVRLESACLQLRIGFTCLGIGIIITSIICGCCCMIVKFARGFASGKTPERPANPVGGALYDVSAKYGNYIPGGTALGQPTGHQADGYPAGPPGAGAPGATESTAYQHGGGTSNYSAAPPGYPGGTGSPAYGAQAPAYGAQAPAYGAQAPAYGAQAPAYGAQAPAYGASGAQPTPYVTTPTGYGAPPAGYSSATPPAYGAGAPPAGYPQV